jgi:hypothetical protein
MESGRSRKETRCRSEFGRDLYSKLKDDVSFRSMWCDKVGLGFRLVFRCFRKCCCCGSGCFDVFAWKGPNYLFIESKRKTADAIQRTQKAWIDAALNAGLQLEALLIYG